MQATRIHLRNMAHSVFLTRRIRQNCARLERFDPQLFGCHVVVARAGTMAGPSYEVTVRLSTPGREIVANHTREANVGVALREAFADARRQLKDEVERRRPAHRAAAGAP